MYVELLEGHSHREQLVWEMRVIGLEANMKILYLNLEVVNRASRHAREHTLFTLYYFFGFLKNKMLHSDEKLFDTINTYDEVIEKFWGKLVKKLFSQVLVCIDGILIVSPLIAAFGCQDDIDWLDDHLNWLRTELVPWNCDLELADFSHE